MEYNLSSFFLPHILALTPYSSAKDEYTGETGVFLDANENPYHSVSGLEWNRYPDPHQKAIKQKIALIKQVEPSQIFLGNGSDEPIDLLIRATCQPAQDSVLIMPPTYGMYQVSASIQNVPVIKVPLLTDYQIDVNGVLAAVEPHTKIVWICSPNNPTGNSINAHDIETILTRFGGLVVVDEAYVDFTSQPSFTTKLAQYPNLVVLQTFSKAWGLASLRAGMAFAHFDIIKILSKIKSPYNMSGPAQAILLEALAHEDSKNELVAQIIEQRIWLTEELTTLPMVQHIYLSDANFLLVKFEDSSRVMQYLLDKQVVVRFRSKVEHCGDAIRITVGTPEENKLLIASLKKM